MHEIEENPLDWADCEVPANHVREGDQIFVDGYWREVVFSRNTYVWEGDMQKKVREIWAKKKDFEWPWDKYDYYGPQENPNYDPYYGDPNDKYWPEDTYNSHIFELSDTVAIQHDSNFLGLDMKPIRWYAVVYGMDRAYGGPEEGGWWFDMGTVITQVPCMTYEQAEEACEKLSEKYKSEGNLYSVNYSGGVYDIVIEEAPGENYPKSRPFYC